MPSYPQISPLPVSPDPNDTATLNSRMFAWVGALPTFSSELGAIVEHLNQLALATGPGAFTNITATGDLTVGGNTSATAIASIRTDATGVGALNFWGSSNSNVGTIEYNHSQDFMRFRVDDAEAMRLMGTGRLGLGTSAPEDLLHIADIDPVMKITNTASITTSAGEEFLGGLVFQGQKNSNYADVAKIAAEQDASTWSSVDALRKKTRLAFYTQDESTDDALTTPRMVINGGGQVGIGTDAPEALLHLSEATPGIKVTSTTNISSTGAATIGEIAFAGRRGELYANTAKIVARQDDNSWSGVDQYNKPTSLAFCTQDQSATDTLDTPRMVIDQDGKVGIGNSDPGHQLHVAGDICFAPGASVAPTENGDVVIEATNNTTLTFKHKGSDGVVRSATLSLS